MPDGAVAVITGAYGGMGRACARQLGRTAELLLTDIDPDRLQSFAEQLREEGYRVAGLVAGDLSEPGLAERAIGAARAAGRVRSIVHTAGLSPALAPPWDAILRANIVATERLLSAVESGLRPGLAAVLIGSVAGHKAPRDAAIDTLFAEPLREDFLPAARVALEPYVVADDRYGLASPAYAQSKRAVIRLCEARAPAWGAQGARIVSISPGIISTPMGRKEAATNPAAARTAEATPVGRWGSPLDISAAAEFLVSDAAAFITGCDLRVDGGVVPAAAGPTF